MVTSYVAYYRVSTGGQARSGLGMAAQKDLVRRFLGSGDQLLAEFVEVQSGRKDHRPELAKALAHAKREGAALVIARLDRFSRRVSFVAGIMEQGVRLVVAEMPNATEFQLHIFAALAQEEQRLVSERTKVALVQAKLRGEILGENGSRLAAKNRRQATEFSMALMRHVDRIGRGLPLAYIARRLNQEGFRTPRERFFTAQSVRNVITRGS